MWALITIALSGLNFAVGNPRVAAGLFAWAVFLAALEAATADYMETDE